MLPCVWTCVHTMLKWYIWRLCEPFRAVSLACNAGRSPGIIHKIARFYLIAQVLRRFPQLSVLILLCQPRAQCRSSVFGMCFKILPILLHPTLPLLYDDLYYGKRSVGGGRPKKPFNHSLKTTLTSFDIDVTHWEACVQNRFLSCGVKWSTAGESRIANAQKKLTQRWLPSANFYREISEVGKIEGREPTYTTSCSHSVYSMLICYSWTALWWRLKWLVL